MIRRPLATTILFLPCFVTVQLGTPGATAQSATVPSPPLLPTSSVSANSAADAAPSEPEISVEELVRRALQSSPLLPIARENQEAARQRAESLHGPANPTLQALPWLAGNRGAADEELVVSQPLDIFGKRKARANVAGAEARRASADARLTERALVVQVESAAADLFAAQESENLARGQVEVARLFRQAAARKAQLGEVPAVQVQRADLEVLRAANDLGNAAADRLARRAGVNQLVGQAPETPMRVTLPLGSDLTGLLTMPGAMGGVQSAIVPPTSTAPPADSTQFPDANTGSMATTGLAAKRSQLLPGALLNRPDLVGAQATLDARRAAVKAADRDRLPDIELQIRRDTVTGGGGSTALRAMVTVPLFDFGSIRHQKRAAQADVRAQEAQIVLLRSQVATQVEQALLRLEQQQKTVERFRSAIVPQTVDLLRKTQIGYAAGASTYLEVLEAQRTLRQVQTEYLQALVGVRSQQASLESALGAAQPAALAPPVNPLPPVAPPGVAAPGTVPSPGILAPDAPTAFTSGSPAPGKVVPEKPNP